MREDRSHAALVFDGETAIGWCQYGRTVELPRIKYRKALEEIGRQGGGLVESFPEDTSGRRVSSAFLFNATLSLFEKCGFERVRPLGKNAWLVRRRVGT